MSAPADQLNGAQRRAVEHAAGPLLVLAGPGTGKTRVITHRIEHMVEARGIAPEKIVALTFTVKAAGEMRSRLAELCKPGVADRVNVHTLHGFGLRLLQRFGDMIGLPGQPELMDSARRRRLLREIVAEHRLFPQMTSGNRDETLTWIEAQCDLLADHAVSAERALACCVAWHRRLEAGEGVLDETDARAQRERLADFEQLLTLREHYERARVRRGWLAYSDFMSLPGRVLREHEGARAIVRNDYRHWLVDEFQDTNAAQIDLLALAAPPEGEPDLYVVGDDDQAIYGFRGADDRALELFAAYWPTHTKVRLEENHRCRQAIIDAANRAISVAVRRFDTEKCIRRPEPDPAAGEPDAAGHVTGVSLPSYRDDGEAVAAMILERRHHQPGLSWNDFAVLARSHADLARVAVALQIEGIPVRRVEKEAEADEGVLDLLAWIQTLVEPTSTLGVRRLLVRAPLRVSPDRVADLEQKYRAARSHALEGVPGAADPGGFVPWLAVHGQKIAAVGALVRRHDELAAHAATGRADEAIFRIVCVAELAHRELLDPDEHARRVEALVRVVRFARTRQSRLDPPGDLRAWWAYYHDLSPKEQSFVDEERLDAGDEADGDPERDAVTLSTVHSAKGLEFDTVFVTRLQPRMFPKVEIDLERVLPPGLEDRGTDARDDKARALDEERRLFYVACTRAKRRLVLLAQRPKKPTKTTNFFEEMFPRRDGTPAGLLIDAAGALGGAARLGVGPGARRAPSGLERETPPATASLADDPALRLAAARREARVLAAGALQRADEPELTAAAFDEVAGVLRAAAEQMAVAAAAGAGRTMPAWASAAGREAGEALARGVAKDPAHGAPPCWAVLRPPLPLSYSFINEYVRCPRCFFVKRVLRMPESVSGAIDLGQTAHRALEEFYLRFQRADAEGSPLPTLADLIDAGRRALYATAGPDREIDRQMQTRLAELLRMVHTRLHNDADHIVECERSHVFPYRHGDREHRFSAKIDRIDTLPDGGVRIIDYKSGGALKRYTQPDADDLQMAIYAMALAHERGIEPAELKGRAEYWLLASGERGILELSSLKWEKVREQIDGAIEGILKGEYPRGRNCSNECDILGPAPGDEE